MDHESQDSLGEEIIEIIKSRTKFFNQNYPVVRVAYQKSYNWPEMDTLRHEITLCLIFGVHQAAITLTNHLLESLLKNALIIHDSKPPTLGERSQVSHAIESFLAILRPAKAKYGSDNLSKNIDRAAQASLITDEQKRQLHEFRKVFRNAYSHADKDKTFGQTRISAQAVHLEDNKFIVEQPENPLLAELLVAHGIAQAMQAEQDAMPYFLYMDSVVCDISTKLFGPTTKEGGGAADSPRAGGLRQ